MRTFVRFALGLALLAMVPMTALAGTQGTMYKDLPEQSQALHTETITLPSGVTLQYAEKGNPNGEAIVFIHGYTDSWMSYRLVLPDISPRYRSIAVTLRGFGDSAKPESGYAGADFAADITALMDALGINKAVLVGHSMGSFIAQQVAFTYPDRVNGLVLVGSAATAYNPVVADLKAYVLTLDDPLDRQFVYDFQASTVYRPLPDGFLDVATDESLKAPARVWKAAVEGVLSEDHAADLAGITASTLVMWGDQDAIFSAAEQHALLAAIPGAELQVYAGTGHAPHWEEPAKFTANLEAFIASLGK
ncbi:MAG TPA: alpha/beta hydrolase [Symbiobacteriaceae bacterium]|nr:alpha/beta hydrolase [Symbiobacteriaceae bacterium]